MSFEPIMKKNKKPSRMRGLEEVRFRQSVPDSGIKAYPAYDENTALLFNAFREVHFAIAHEMRTFISL